MKTLTFKTTINCGGCVGAVTPILKSIKSIAEWNVDIKNPSKILTVTGEHLSSHEITEAIEQAGYQIEEVK
jgi:copper chaperone CopZ